MRQNILFGGAAVTIPSGLQTLASGGIPSRQMQKLKFWYVDVLFVSFTGVLDLCPIVLLVTEGGSVVPSKNCGFVYFLSALPGLFLIYFEALFAVFPFRIMFLPGVLIDSFLIILVALFLGSSLSEKVFNFPSFLKYIFTWCSISSWEFFAFGL